MRQIAQRIAERLAGILASWENVECVLLGEQAEVDPLDPYFALVIDVYHRGAVPDSETRRKAFGDPGAFESAQVQPKDRFFLESLPVHIEYKSVASVEEILDRGAGVLWILKNSGTYLFYRLGRGTCLYSRGSWLEGIRARIASMPEEVWLGLRESFQFKMEHYLADLGAAARMDDGFFYMISAGGFCRYAAACLFMINRRFEPSHRSIYSSLAALPVLPADFSGRWDSLLREGGATREQRYKIAELIAKSVVALP